MIPRWFHRWAWKITAPQAVMIVVGVSVIWAMFARYGDGWTLSPRARE